MTARDQVAALAAEFARRAGEVETEGLDQKIVRCLRVAAAELRVAHRLVAGRWPEEAEGRAGDDHEDPRLTVIVVGRGAEEAVRPYERRGVRVVTRSRATAVSAARSFLTAGPVVIVGAERLTQVERGLLDAVAGSWWVSISVPVGVREALDKLLDTLETGR